MYYNLILKKDHAGLRVKLWVICTIKLKFFIHITFANTHCTPNSYVFTKWPWLLLFGKQISDKKSLVNLFQFTKFIKHFSLQTFILHMVSGKALLTVITTMNMSMGIFWAISDDQSIYILWCSVLNHNANLMFASLTTRRLSPI